jgi:hypothetical protein
MPDDPLDDYYLETLRAATRLDAPVFGPGPLMDAIAEAIDDTRWRDQQQATSA